MLLLHDATEVGTDSCELVVKNTNLTGESFAV